MTTKTKHCDTASISSSIALMLLTCGIFEHCSRSLRNSIFTRSWIRFAWISFRSVWHVWSDILRNIFRKGDNFQANECGSTCAYSCWAGNRRKWSYCMSRWNFWGRNWNRVRLHIAAKCGFFSDCVIPYTWVGFEKEDEWGFDCCEWCDLCFGKSLVVRWCRCLRGGGNTEVREIEVIFAHGRAGLLNTNYMKLTNTHTIGSYN